MRTAAEDGASRTLVQGKFNWEILVERQTFLHFLHFNRQNTISHDVPYYRLLESSPKANSIKVSTPTAMRDSESRLLTPKAIKVQAPKTSASDSRLTMEYFQGDDCQMSTSDELTELSQSAPQPHPLESDSEHSLSPKVPDEVIIRDVQRTVSLTSENPSEAFFSADEDLHASRSSSLKATTADMSTVIPKKRFASDLSIVGPNELEGKLSTHRSDYEIHTPEHRSLPMRPQSTAELVRIIQTAKFYCMHRKIQFMLCMFETASFFSVSQRRI